MPVTDEKELKRYLSSELFKNQIRPIKLDWAQAAGRLLQIAIHGEIGSRFPFPDAKPRTRIEKEHYQNRLDDARSVWAFRLDEDTLDFVHCDLCLEALALKDSQAMAETVWRPKGKTVH
jgi:hypothetical protein